MKQLTLLFCLVTGSLQAQPAGKKAYEFRGRVEQVDVAAGRVTVHNEPIEGWMGSMTMAYRVDQADVLTRLKAGDQITAKVYEGDSTLHDVKVVSASLRLRDLEQMALESNPTVAQAKADLRAANGMARQAGLYPNPTVGYYGDEIRGGYFGGGKQGGFVSQTIVLGGKLRAARRVAELDASQVETGGEAQRQRVLNNVRVAFYQTLAAQRLVEVRKNLAKLAGDAAETSHQLGNVGQADRPDLLQAEVEQEQADVGVRTAEQNLRASWRMLASVAGKPDLPPGRLDGDVEAIPDIDYDRLLAAALRESPAVKLAQQSVARAEALLVQAKKAPIPDLQVTGILSQNYEPLDLTRRRTGLEGGAQVGVQLPIFNRNQGAVEAAKGEIESARQELARVKLEITRDLAGLFRDYDAARVTVRQYKAEMLPRAEKAYELYQANYQNMAAAYPQVLLSQRTLFRLEADYIQALEDAWQSALLIQGFGLGNGLARPMK